MVQFSKAPCGARYDRICINDIKAYCCIFFTGPLRLVQMFGILTIALLLALLIKTIFGKERVQEITNKDGKKKKFFSFDQEQSTLYWILFNTTICICGKIFLFASGARVTEKKLKISDFFADYVKYEEKNKNFRAPIMISNHVTFIDFSLYYSKYEHMPSSLAGSFMRTIPFFGKILQAVQAIFVDNTSADTRLMTLKDIKTRINNIMEHKNFPKIQIYPEGATNNGEEQMKFKTGAFENFNLLQICGIKLNDLFKPSHLLVNNQQSVVSLFVQMFQDITYYEFDNFDPQYTLDKHGIKKDDPRAVELVIEDVRYLYEYAFGLRVKSNISFATRNTMEWYCSQMENGLSYEPSKLR